MVSWINKLLTSLCDIIAITLVIREDLPGIVHSLWLSRRVSFSTFAGLIRLIRFGN